MIIILYCFSRLLLPYLNMNDMKCVTGCPVIVAPLIQPSCAAGRQLDINARRDDRSRLESLLVELQVRAVPCVFDRTCVATHAARGRVLPLTPYAPSSSPQRRCGRDLRRLSPLGERLFHTVSVVSSQILVRPCFLVLPWVQSVNLVPSCGP